jgi:hypothetical protein
VRIPFSCPIRFFSHLVFLLETLVNQRLLGNETALPFQGGIEGGNSTCVYTVAFLRGKLGIKVPLFKGDLGGSRTFDTDKKTFQTSFYKVKAIPSQSSQLQA